MSSKKISFKIYAIALLAVVVAVFLIKGCLGEEKGNDFKMKIPDIENVSANIKNVNLYVDFSGSMRGFIDGVNTNSKDFDNFKAKMVSVVSDGLTNFANNYDISPISHCGKKAYNNAQFRKAMEDHSIFIEKVTLLHEMIEKSFDDMSDSSVNILVSDMVMSYGRNKLIAEKDTSYNKHHLADLSNSVYAVFMALKKKNIHAVLLQYYSDYNGKNYYNYTENLKKNNYVNLMMKNRPFYILICGSESNLRRIMSDKCYTGYEHVYATFRLPHSTVQPFSITSDKPNVWRIGDDPSKGKGTIWSDVASNNDEAHISLKCKAFRIPEYVNVSTNIKYDKSSISSVICPNFCYSENGEYTFDVTLKPYGEWKKNMNSFISIVTDNEWYTEASSMDDIEENASMLEGKTWGFSSFINAINKAYFGSPDKRPEEELARFEFIVSK